MHNDSLEEIRSRYKEGKYQEALSLIEKAEQERLLHPEVLVLKGCCIQLEDGETAYNLSDAKRAFEQALEIDEEFAPAIIELAWFYLNTLDDAIQAAPFFERAVRLNKLLLTEAIIGMAKCLLETKTKDIAMKYLEESINGSLDLIQIQKTISEIQSLSK
jgi:tetratricopeptide (TPR) repeat protein